MKLYSIRDEKMNGYHSAPFEAPDDQTALSSVRDGLLGQPPSSVLRLKACDSVLCCVGEFDHDIGALTPKRYDVCHLGDLPLNEEVE